MGFFGDQQGGSGTPTASWKPRGLGDGVVGTIVETHIGKAFEYAKDGQGPEKKDAAGNPIPKLAIILQTQDVNDYANATRPLVDGETGQKVPDDGRRALHVEKNTNLSFALARALAEHQLDDVEVGGQLWVKYAEDGQGARGTFRKFEASYKPAPQTSGFGFGDQQQAAPPQQPQQQWQQPQQTQQAPPPQAPPAQQAPPQQWQGQPQGTQPGQGAPPQAPAPAGQPSFDGAGNPPF